MMTDPIGDMLTRIRNAALAKKPTMDLPDAKLKRMVLEVLKREGYIQKIERVSAPTPGEAKTAARPAQKKTAMKGTPSGAKTASLLRVTLRYEDRTPPFSRIKRLSRPGLRRYVKRHEIPRPLGGTGLVILSTPQGVMSGKEAREKGIGGELLCEIY